MRPLLTIILAVMTVISARADKYAYTFRDTPISEAIVRISKNHPDVNISFIYKELDNYRTSARINTDNPYDALRQAIGLNPITVVKKGNSYYVEALQRGKFRYTGQAVGSDGEPVVAAAVMLLAPADSTVLTYGITDNAGRFSIPCDRQGVIAKLTSVGYRPTFHKCNSFKIGTITMKELPVQLRSVKVEGDNAFLYSDKSVYIPTSNQKNSAQTAQDLISRMAIPQLRIGEDLKTTTGQPVVLFIDYIPATSSETGGMRMADVKRVEYYDYPSDPRFQGKPHVINFIMQKYEYGGYVKGIYYDNFVVSRQLNGYAKVQYKKMTLDWAGGGFYMDDRKDYNDTYETFRLPQEDGTIKEFTRTSEVDKYRRRRNTYWTSVKALYRTEKTSISNMISADFNHIPKETSRGQVAYNPADFESSDYNTRNSNYVNSLIYNGYWYFSLPHGNTLTFNPQYAYTHTRMNTFYDEIGMASITNGAKDDSHQANGSLTYTHSFGKAGTLNAMFQGQFLQNRTHYSGTSDISDKATTFAIGPSLNYSYNNDKFYGNIGAGLYWDRSEYGSIKESSAAPLFNLSLQYAFNRKNSASIDFSCGKSIPPSSYRSAAVVKAYPLMSYTGNPSLVPYGSYLLQASYTFIPNNKFNFSAFGYAWFIDNRYVYDYEADATGILRTIKQPMGSYEQYQYGVQGSTRLLDNKLQLGLSVYMEHIHNGAPYNWTKSNLNASLSAYYYLGNVYFGANYNTPSGYGEGSMVGTWMKDRDTLTFQIGWSDKHWNLRFFTRNFYRYNTYQTKAEMKSKYYDSVRYLYNSSAAGFFQISATYTFGFGKKIKAENEAYQVSGAASGILK